MVMKVDGNWPRHVVWGGGGGGGIRPRRLQGSSVHRGATCLEQSSTCKTNREDEVHASKQDLYPWSWVTNVEQSVHYIAR